MDYKPDINDFINVSLVRIGSRWVNVRHVISVELKHFKPHNGESRRWVEVTFLSGVMQFVDDDAEEAIRFFRLEADR